jgi:hypothetical protein
MSHGERRASNNHPTICAVTLGAPGAQFGFPLERGNVNVRSVIEGQSRVLNASLLLICSGHKTVCRCFISRQGKANHGHVVQFNNFDLLAKRSAFIQSNSGVLPLQPHTSVRSARLLQSPLFLTPPLCSAARELDSRFYAPVLS